MTMAALENIKNKTENINFLHNNALSGPTTAKIGKLETNLDRDVEKQYNKFSKKIIYIVMQVHRN